MKRSRLHLSNPQAVVQGGPALAPREHAPSFRPVRPIRRGVIGILNDAERYLLIQRAPGVALGGAWCFPGGHVEPNENARRAVIRELHEELGIHVRPFHRLGAVAGRPDVMLAIWLVEHTEGEFRARESEIADMAWLTANEIRMHPRGLPSNLPVVDRLEAWRRNGGS